MGVVNEGAGESQEDVVWQMSFLCHPCHPGTMLNQGPGSPKHFSWRDPDKAGLWHE